MIFLSTSFSYIHTWFTQGLLHPLQTPSHLILIISISFLIGQATTNKQLLNYFFAITVAVITGIILNQNIRIPSHWNIELILLCVALIIGLLVVIRFKKINAILLSLLAIFSSLLLGYDSSPVVIPGLGSNSIYNWMAGAMICVVTSITLLSLIALILRPYWDGIILRVIGSWIATSALFTLTLSFSKF